MEHAIWDLPPEEIFALAQTDKCHQRTHCGSVFVRFLIPLQPNRILEQNGTDHRGTKVKAAIL